MEDLLRTVLPLAFSSDRETVKSIAVILLKVAHQDTFMLLESRSMSALLNLFVLAVQYWVLELVASDPELQRLVLDLLESLTRCPAFASTFRSSAVMSKLMGLSTLVQGQAKMRIVKLVGVLSKVQAVESRYDSTILKATTTDQAPPDYARAPPRGGEGTRTEGVGMQRELTRNESYLSTIPRQTEPVRQTKPEPRTGYRDPDNTRQRYQDARETREVRVSRETRDVRESRETPYEAPDYGRAKPQDPPYEPYAERSRQGTPAYNTDQPEEQMTRIISDYVDMLTPGNSTEMVVFALQSIHQSLNGTSYAESIDIVIHEPLLFTKILNLIELVVPANVQDIQKRILGTLAAKLSGED